MNAQTETVEQEIQRKGLTAPRVTPADIEANISGEYFFTADKATAGCPQFESLKLLTFCVLVLKNGYTVHGVSACASPENFDEALGQRIARTNAVNAIWPLMGYALRQNLMEMQAPPPQVMSDS
jgi:hypothetical protein